MNRFVHVLIFLLKYTLGALCTDQSDNFYTKTTIPTDTYQTAVEKIINKDPTSINSDFLGKSMKLAARLNHMTFNNTMSSQSYMLSAVN